MKRSVFAALLLVGVAAFSFGCGSSSRKVSAKDAPPGLQETQHLLGVIESEMDKRPEEPASAFKIPPGLLARVEKNGFFDPKVRAWAKKKVAAEKKPDALLASIYARIVPEAERARTMADDLNPNDAVSIDFIQKFAEFARAEQRSVELEGVVNSELRDDMALVSRTVAAYEEFLAEVRAGRFASQTDLQNAATQRLGPMLAEIRKAQQTEDAARTRDENAFDARNRAISAFETYLKQHSSERRLVEAIAAVDPKGLFARIA